MTIVNKFNVNKQEVTLDADIIENMSANDVSYDTSTQYDENTVGDKLSELDNSVKELSVETAFETGENLTLFQEDGYYSSVNGQFAPSANDKVILIPYVNKNFRVFFNNIISFSSNSVLVVLRDYSLIGNKKIIYKKDFTNTSGDNYYADVEIESPCSVIIQYGSGNDESLSVRTFEYKKDIDTINRQISAISQETAKIANIEPKVDILSGGNLTPYVKNGYYSSVTGQFDSNENDRSILVPYIDNSVRVRFKNLTDKSANGISLSLRYTESNIQFETVKNGQLISDGGNDYHYDIKISEPIAFVIMYGTNNTEDLHISVENLNSKIIDENATYMKISNDIVVGDLSIGSIISNCSVSKNGNGINMTTTSQIVKYNNIFTTDLSDIPEVGIGDIIYTYIKYTSSVRVDFYGILGTAVTPMKILVGENLYASTFYEVTSNYSNSERNLMRLNTDFPVGTINIHSIVKVNLTKIYGKGNEPSKDSFDRLLTLLGDNFVSEKISVKQYIEYLDTKLVEAEENLLTLNKSSLDLINVLDKTGLLNMDKKWELISPYFAPPLQYDGVFGDYSDPLKFYDGRIVSSSSDWEERRAEIKEKWTSIMGEWPELNTEQKLSITKSEQKCGYTKHTVTFEWIDRHTTTGYLLVPDNDVPGRNEYNLRPAIITVFYDAETAIGESNNPNYYTMDYALQAVSRGYIALSIGDNPASASSSSFFYPNKEASTIQPLSVMAYCAANAYYALCNYDGVNKDKVGITGLSYGGKWALFASCLFDKFACGAWGDPGVVFDRSDGNKNYWDDWYLGHPTVSYPGGAYAELEAQKLQLTELMALMAPRPFLVSGGVQDKINQWSALNYEIKVNNVLSETYKVAMTNRHTHISDDESNRQMFWFFDYFLKPDHVIDH